MCFTSFIQHLAATSACSASSIALVEFIIRVMCITGTRRPLIKVLWLFSMYKTATGNNVFHNHPLRQNDCIVAPLWLRPHTICELYFFSYFQQSGHVCLWIHLIFFFPYGTIAIRGVVQVVELKLKRRFLNRWWKEGGKSEWRISKQSVR